MRIRVAMIPINIRRSPAQFQPFTLLSPSAQSRPAGGWLRGEIDPERVFRSSYRSTSAPAIASAGDLNAGPGCLRAAPRFLVPRIDLFIIIVTMKSSRGEGCNFRPGSNPNHKDGNPMTQADSVHSTPPTIAPTRTRASNLPADRHFARGLPLPSTRPEELACTSSPSSSDDGLAQWLEAGRRSLPACSGSHAPPT